LSARMILRGCCSSASIFGFFMRVSQDHNPIESDHDLISLFEHDLSKNRFPLFRIMLGLRLPLHRTPEKGRKDCPTAANIPVKGGQIEVNRVISTGSPRIARSIDQGEQHGRSRQEK
jgi:hypothetical protein